MHDRRWLLTLFVVATMAGCAPSKSDSARVVEEYWPGGSLHMRRSVITNWRGEEINHGPLEVWYENGQRRSLGHWKHGLKHGPFTYWHENGQKKMELTNVNGRAQGRVLEWTADGQLIRNDEWRDGRPLKR